MQTNPEVDQMTANGKQNALVYYVRMFVYMLLALVLRVIALAPAACLFVCDGWMRWLSVLCPVLVIFVILPLRWSFAQTMTQRPRRFSFDVAFSFAHYGEKLRGSLLHVLHVFKWGLPLAAMAGGAYYCYTQVDALTLFQSINEIGNACAAGLTAAANWIAGLVGGTEMVVTANNFMLGAGAVAAVFGLGVLIWLWGAVRNSATRYIWAIAAETDRVPRAEVRRRLQNRRMRQLGVGLINLILLLPFLYTVFAAGKTAVSDLSTMLRMAITTGELPTVDLLAVAAPVAGAFFALYLPLLPLRRWNTAAFALRKRRVNDEKKVAA